MRTVREPIRTALAVLVVAAVPAGAVAVPSFAGTATQPTIRTATTTTTTTCPSGWGSLPEAGNRPGMAEGALTNVRAGRHACYDRLVVDISDRGMSYSVRYVPAVSMDGSDAPVPLLGGAKLRIIVSPPDHEAGEPDQPTYGPANRRELVNVTGYRTLRQVAHAGTFEAQTTVGVGVRARLPFRTFTLAGPGRGSRLVIDIAHRW